MQVFSGIYRKLQEICMKLQEICRKFIHPRAYNTHLKATQWNFYIHASDKTKLRKHSESTRPRSNFKQIYNPIIAHPICLTLSYNQITFSKIKTHFPPKNPTKHPTTIQNIKTNINNIIWINTQHFNYLDLALKPSLSSKSCQ